MPGSAKGKNDGEGEFIFRPFITVNGKRIIARHYGMKAFKIRIRKGAEKTKDSKKKDSQ